MSYRVLEAENGKAAARQIETIEVDLLIMNLAMPKKVLKPSAHCTSSGHGLSVAVLLEVRAKEGGEEPSPMTKENATVDKNHKRSFDVEGAVTRLVEAVASLKRQVAALEAALEDLKLCYRHPAPSPRPRRAGKNG